MKTLRKQLFAKRMTREKKTSCSLMAMITIILHDYDFM